jgi:hypothetical protein
MSATTASAGDKPVEGRVQHARKIGCIEIGRCFYTWFRASRSEIAMRHAIRCMLAASLILSSGALAQAAEIPPTPSPADAAFLRLKSLEGEWIDTSGSSAGKGKTGAIWRVTSGGSAVIETVFPGTSHEMVSVYTREGDSIVMSHYCAMGNQPRMRAKPDGGDELVFAFDGGGNIDPAKDMHMHEGTVEFGADGSLRSEWQTWADGKAGEHRAVFQLARK